MDGAEFAAHSRDSGVFVDEGRLQRMFEAAVVHPQWAVDPELGWFLRDERWLEWSVTHAKRRPEVLALVRQFDAHAFHTLMFAVLGPAPYPRARMLEASCEHQAWTLAVQSDFRALTNPDGVIEHPGIDQPYVGPSIDFEAVPFRQLLDSEATRRAGFPSSLQLLSAVFANADGITGDDDESNYSACRAADFSGRNAVFAHDEAGFLKSTPVASSIAAYLLQRRSVDGVGAGSTAGPEPVPAHCDSGALARRSRWFVGEVFGVGQPGNDAMNDVAPVALFEEERDLLAHHPHLALYWLLHHFVAGNETQLEQTVRALANSTHPWIGDLEEYLHRSCEGYPSRERHAGTMHHEAIMEFRQRGPERAFAEARTPASTPLRSPERFRDVGILGPLQTLLSAAELSQRDKLEALEGEWTARLQATPEAVDDAGRLVRKAISSKKLQARRDSWLATISSRRNT